MNINMCTLDNEGDMLKVEILYLWVTRGLGLIFLYPERKNILNTEHICQRTNSYNQFDIHIFIR